MKRIMMILLVLLLWGCGTQKVTVAKQTSDREAVRIELRVDSVHVRDSVYIDRSSDTILVERWHTDWKYRVIEKADTIRERDSIPYEVQVVKEVRVRNAYDKFTARGFWILLAIAVLILAGWIGGKTKYGKIAVAFLKSMI